MSTCPPNTRTRPFKKTQAADLLEVVVQGRVDRGEDLVLRRQVQALVHEREGRVQAADAQRRARALLFSPPPGGGGGG